MGHTMFSTYFVTREVMKFAFTRAHRQAVSLPKRNIHLFPCGIFFW